MDPFNAALEELSAALLMGTPVEKALQEVAEDHGLRVEALRNRASKAFGSLEDHAKKKNEVIDNINKSNAKSHDLRIKRRCRNFLSDFKDAGFQFWSASRFTKEQIGKIHRMLIEHHVEPGDCASLNWTWGEQLVARCEEEIGPLKKSIP